MKNNGDKQKMNYTKLNIIIRDKHEQTTPFHTYLIKGKINTADLERIKEEILGLLLHITIEDNIELFEIEFDNYTNQLERVLNQNNFEILYIPPTQTHVICLDDELNEFLKKYGDKP